jgi:hypothetical protein
MSKIKIKKAEYGANDTWIDVTEKFKSYYKENKKKEIIKFNGNIFNGLFTDPVPNVVKDLKVKFKVKETEEVMKVSLKESKDHVFPNLSDSDSESSESESSEEEEEDEEEGKCRWDVVPTGYTVSKNKKIIERSNGTDRIVFSKKPCSKFKIKIITSKSWIGTIKNNKK